MRRLIRPLKDSTSTLADPDPVENSRLFEGKYLLSFSASGPNSSSRFIPSNVGPWMSENVERNSYPQHKTDIKGLLLLRA